MTDPTYADFKRKERELDMKYAGRDYDKWKPLNRHERSILRFAERVLVVALVSFALVETVYQVCLWRIR